LLVTFKCSWATIYYSDQKFSTWGVTNVASIMSRNGALIENLTKLLKIPPRRERRSVSGRNDIDGRWPGWAVLIGLHWDQLFWVVVCRALTPFNGSNLPSRSLVSLVGVQLQNSTRFRSSGERKTPSSSPPPAKAWWLACQNLQDFVGWFENKGRVATKAAHAYFLRFFSSSKSCQFESDRYSSDITGISLECDFSLLSGISRLRSDLPPPSDWLLLLLMGIFERFGIMRSILTVECVGWFGTKRNIYP